MEKFVKLFGRSRSVVIGMVHLRALPGSPRASLDVEDITRIACNEASMYQKAGYDGILIENMHDLPWQRPEEVGPETVAAMAVVCSKVRQCCPHLPIGIQILSAANRQALAVAKAAGLNFMRAEGYVFSHIADEGPTHSCAADLVRYRDYISADHISIYTDIKKKHCSHAITSDVSIGETAQAAELFLSDGVIITGSSTGMATNPREVNEVQECVEIPVLIGSGVTEENIHQYMSSSAFIVGSSLKQNGVWHKRLDPGRVTALMDRVRSLQGLEKRQSTGGSTDQSQHFTSILSQGE